MATRAKQTAILTAALENISNAPQTPRQRVLDEASEIVHNDRNKQYGNPEDNFANIARLWNAYIYAQTGGAIQHVISVHDVPIMCMLIKIARLATNQNHHDSTVDIAGYAACLGDIQAGSHALDSMDQPVNETEISHHRNNERNKLRK